MKYPFELSQTHTAGEHCYFKSVKAELKKKSLYSYLYKNLK